jgi:asparagine synthetase B (glutamine-hydrolysing)
MNPAPWASESFAAQPFVCGALGDDELGLYSRLLAVAPTNVSVLWSTRAVRFAASTSPGLERAKSGWTWGRYVAKDTKPRNARDASQDIGLAGFWPDPAGAIVHTDWLGTQDVYLRRIGGTTYWANRIAPLITFAEEVVHPDVEAWRTALVLWGFTAASSPFKEVRRLDAGERLVLRGSVAQVECDQAGWLKNPSGDATVGQLAEALEAAVPRTLLEAPHLTLSGGLDSRLLLAASLSRGGRRPVTWSTSHESGWDGDTRLAEEVATSAGTHHHEIDYGVQEWSSAREATLLRLEHSTALHTWLLPLAQRLHHAGRRKPLLDGLAGDVLLRYHDQVQRGEQERRCRRIWATLGGESFRRSPLLDPRIATTWADDAFEAWHVRMRVWDEHPFGETVIRMLTRTRRTIAASPFRLFGPERRVITPFIDPDVVRIALSVPPQPDDDRDLRPLLLRVLNSTLASIASTTDRRENQRSFTQRGPTSSTATRAMVRAVENEPAVARLFDRTLLADLEARTAGEVNPEIVRRGAMLAHWLGRWRPYLAEIPRFD